MGLLALAVVAAIAIKGLGDDSRDLDKASYTAGYKAFGDAWLPGSDESRDIVEARCRELSREFPSEEIVNLNLDDWVAGCADYVEGKDSRFAPK